MAERALDRLAVGLLESCGKQVGAFPSRLVPYLVAELGPVRAVRWFAVNAPRYERTVRTLGRLRTHLACTVVSLYNSCAYTSFGHAYALELVYLKERERLFPVDARTISTWVDLKPAELRDRVCDALQRADLHVEVIWVDRTLALTTGEQRAMDQDEARIAHLVRMLTLLNSLGVGPDVEPAEAHDPLNADQALKARHAALRASAA